MNWHWIWRRWALGLTAGCSLLVQADEHDDLFQQLDKNRDGQVSKDEVGEERQPLWARLLRTSDADKNQSLSLAEFRQGLTASPPSAEPQPGGPGVGLGGPPGGGPFGPPGEMFQRMDRNGDGKLTRDEIPEPARERLGQLFDRLNTNEITRERFLELAERMRGGGGEGGRPPGGGPEGMFDLIDRNGDGKVTRDEVGDRGRPMIEALLSRLGKDELTREDFRNLGGRRPDGPGGPDDRPEGNRDRPRRPEGDANNESRDPGPGNPPRRPDGPPRDGDRPRGDRQSGPPPGDRGPGDRGPGGRGPGGHDFPPPPLMELLDTDRDHRISLDEWRKAAEHFEKLDRNHDQFLDPPELLGPPPGGMGPGGPGGSGPGGRRPGDRGPEGARRGPPPGGDERRGPPPGGPGGDERPRRPEMDDAAANGIPAPNVAPRGPGGRPDASQVFSHMDRNRDGQLSSRELPERMRQAILRLDQDNNGTVSSEEWSQGAERLREAMGSRQPAR